MMKSSPLQPSKPKVCKLTFETIQRVSGWSACGRRRYRLGRFWTSGPIACVIGLNPSVANAHTDDPTNRRLISLLGDLGFGGYWLVNLIAESTPYPDQLGRRSRRLSMVNRQVIEQAIGESHNNHIDQQQLCFWQYGEQHMPQTYQLSKGLSLKKLHLHV